MNNPCTGRCNLARISDDKAHCQTCGADFTFSGVTTPTCAHQGVFRQCYTQEGIDKIVARGPGTFCGVCGERLGEPEVWTTIGEMKSAEIKKPWQR